MDQILTFLTTLLAVIAGVALGLLVGDRLASRRWEHRVDDVITELRVEREREVELVKREQGARYHAFVAETTRPVLWPVVRIGRN